MLVYKNLRKAIRDRVDDENKTVNETFTVNGTSQHIINYSGHYSLILVHHSATKRTGRTEYP